MHVLVHEVIELAQAVDVLVGEVMRQAKPRVNFVALEVTRNGVTNGEVEGKIRT